MRLRLKLPPEVFDHDGVVRRIVLWGDRRDLGESTQPDPVRSDVGVGVAGHAEQFPTVPNANPSVRGGHERCVGEQRDALISHVPIDDHFRIEACCPGLEVRSPCHVPTSGRHSPELWMQDCTVRRNVVSNEVVDEALVEIAHGLEVGDFVAHDRRDEE